MLAAGACVVPGSEWGGWLSLPKAGEHRRGKRIPLAALGRGDGFGLQGRSLPGGRGAGRGGGLGPVTLSAGTLEKNFPFSLSRFRAPQALPQRGSVRTLGSLDMLELWGSRRVLEQNFGTASVGGGRLVVASLPESAGEQHKSLKLVNQTDLRYF